MASSVLISSTTGVSMSTQGFLYIIEAIRPFLTNSEEATKCEIYEPFDDEGMDFIALDNQAEEGFNIFYRAAKSALLKSSNEDPNNAPLELWQELINALEVDNRWNGKT
jgi:hypothetical protein